MKRVKNLKSTILNHRTLVSNFGYLSILQVINLAIPLAVYPYLIRTLGSTLYGVIIFAQAIIGYLQVLVNFGFDAFATKDISLHRDNKIKVSEIVSSVLILKGCLFFCSILLLTIIILFIPQANNNKTLFYLTLWICLYDWIFPIWYFQGVEKMKFITFFTLISRSVFVSLVFVFIKVPGHYLRLPIINGIGAIIAGSVSLFFIFKVEKVRFIWQSIEVLKTYFKSSFPLFVSGVSVKLFAQANKVVIGSFLGMDEVAYYDLADKVINFLKMPQLMISQVIFPKVSKSNSREFRKKMLQASILLALGLIILVQIFAPKIVMILGGESMSESINLLRIYSIILLLIYMSQYTSVHTLLANGYNSKWMQVVIGSGLVYIISVTALVLLDAVSVKSLIFSNIASEFYLLITGYIFSQKLNLI